MAKRVDPDKARAQAFVLGERYESLDGRWHAHRRAQLIHVSEGVVTVHADAGVWVVPPQRAVWVPGGVRHRVTSRRPFWLRTLYVRSSAGRGIVPASVKAVTVDRLVDALLVAASELGSSFGPTSAAARLVRVILDRLPALETAPLDLPEPRDPRLKRVTTALLANPADARTLDDLAALPGVSARTIARLFQRETGMSFRRWRQRRRTLAALEGLAAGKSVTTVAWDVGYDDCSAFIAMFKSELGTTPARYFASR